MNEIAETPNEPGTLAAMLPLRRVARITLEALSPLSIGAGRSDDVFDVQLVRDVNHLPTIPGTALAGVLRSSVRDALGAAEADSLFGCAGDDESSAPSRVSLTWAHIHDSTNSPVDGLVTDARRLRDDAVLGPLLLSDLPKREHVRLGHRGVAKDTGKFDRTYVPRGHRFTFDIGLADGAQALMMPLFERLIECLSAPSFRLGGATMRGYGQLQVVRCLQSRFDLRKPSDLARFGALPVRLDIPWPIADADACPSPVNMGRWEIVRVKLTAADFWRVGSGRRAFARGAKVADMLPYSDTGVAWRGDRGNIGPAMLVIPAASIKGALAHRVAYHANCLAGRFADQTNGVEATCEDEDPGQEVRALFGEVLDHAEHGGRRGAVQIDDVLISPKEVAFMQIMHNSLDRFTGGTREGVLFGEEMVFGGQFELCVRIDREGLCTAGEIGKRARLALERSLTDLTEGRLAIGAAQARGHGYFRGEWSTQSAEAGADTPGQAGLLEHEA